MSDSLDESFDPQALEALLHDVPLEVTVELGRIHMSLSELASRLGPGSIITLDTATGAPLDVRVNGRAIARAEAIAVGEKTGIRIVELIGKES
jgi:flagellar motor switch protein FliN/FliY